MSAPIVVGLLVLAPIFLSASSARAAQVHSTRFHIVQLAITGDLIFYVAQRGSLDRLVRIDLATGKAVTVLSRRRGEPGELGALAAGGGIAAVQTGSSSPSRELSRVLRIDAHGVSTVVAGAFGRRCGKIARLLDVSPQGEVVTDETRTPCRSSRKRPPARSVIVRSGPSGRVPLQGRRVPHAHDVMDGDDPLRARLVGDRLLLVRDRRATVRHLGTGQVIVVRPRLRGGDFLQADLDPEGGLVTTTVAYGEDERIRTEARYHEPGVTESRPIPTAEQTLLFDARFCGRAILDWSVDFGTFLGRETIGARSSFGEERREIWTRGGEGTEDAAFACDATRLAVAWDRRGEPYRVEVFGL